MTAQMAGLRPILRAVGPREHVRAAWVVAWSGMVVAALANGTLRALVTQPLLGEVAARQLATLLLRGADTMRLDQGSPANVVPERFLGRVRVTVTPTAGKAVFVGIAPATDAAQYLSGVQHTTVTELRPLTEGGPATASPPAVRPRSHPDRSTSGRPAPQVPARARSTGRPGPETGSWSS